MLKTSVPGVHRERRLRLSASEPEACFVFFGNREVVRSNSTHFPFRQDSDFLYLTGFDEPEAVLVMVAGRSHLFVLERNETREIWDGERYGLDRARSIFGFDETHPVQEFHSKLEELLVDATSIRTTLGLDVERDRALLKTIHAANRFRGKGRFGHLPIHSPLPELSEMRSVKDSLELASIRKACRATVRAHLEVLRKVRSGMTEFDAFIEFQYTLLRQGCSELGYGPIFASGFNATTLHYTRNNDLLKEGDLFLIDAAGECDGYTADLTQTFPVSRAFQPAQARVYEQVLNVNREITAWIKPGVSYRELHARSVDLLTESLLALGVLSGDLKELVASGAYRKYYPHGVGHYLGLDVHDAGIYQERGRDFQLQPGMVLTNEPGLYFRDPGPYSGIGIRIEEDILVTETGSEVLTAGLPRTIEEIESVRSGGVWP
jgi:Xaa-Pro aminopeptidase